MSTTVQEEIWEILHRLAVRSEETDRIVQETSQQMKETDRIVKETSQQMKETDRKMKETDRKMKETDRKLKEVTTAIGRLGNRLGQFVEEMVRPTVVRLFQERGIEVHQVHSRLDVERDGDAMEIDMLVVNTTDAILVEAKSELRIDDIKEHIERLARFKKLCPQYAGFRVMGAVAAMVVSEEAARHAYRQGLFVLGQRGDTMVIRNDAKFQPRIW